MGRNYDFVFIHSSISPFGAAGYVLKHLNFLAEELCNRGYTVGIKFIPIHYIKITWQEFKKGGISFRNFLIAFVLNLIFYNSITFELSTLILSSFNKDFKWEWNEKSDIIVGHEQSLPETKRFVVNSWESADFLASKDLNVPCYYIIYHNHEKDFPGMESLISSTYKASFRKIVTTEPIRTKFNLDEKFKMRVALDPNKIKDMSNEFRQPNSVLIPLRKGHIKGSDYAIKAIDIVLAENPDITFYAFGNLSFNSENERVVFLGRVSDEKLLELYQKCEIFVLPSVEDGIPGPALEAMLNGCAPICTDISGASEIIENKKNGIIVPIKNERALADAVLFLNSKPEMIKKFRTENMKLKGKFTPEAMCDSFLNCVSEYER